MNGVLHKSFLAAAAVLLAGCGDMPGSLRRGQGAAGGPGSCLEGGCHSSVVSPSRVHEPAAAGDCTACHERLHGEHPAGDGPEFGTVMARSPFVCYDCHTQPEARPVYAHMPWRMGRCGECHEPHGSELPALVKRDVNGLCLYCHRDLAARTERAKVSHVAAGQTCIETCHYPHRSANRRLLRGSEEAICTPCHTVSEGCGVLLKKREATSSGVCTPCHYPHASVLPNMLKKNRFLPRSRP